MKHQRLAAWLVLYAAILHPSFSQAQAVTEIITDYNGFWRSSVATPNATKPENSHNLLAFTFNGVRYSTGADNSTLLAQGLSFTSGDYRALGVSNIGNAGGSTRLAVGASWDGVPGGASSPVPSRALAQYITDGIQGLDIGTGVANLPAGTLVFGVNGLQPSSIGDGIPDILVTQFADPSGGADSYQFINSSNAIVGNSVSIAFSSIDSVGGWIGDFYNASANPVTLASHETRAPKPIRLWAADFSAFGITTANAGSITSFRINLNGNSDVAFIAYNNAVVSILPVTLTSFTAQPEGDGVQLRWQVAEGNKLANTQIEVSSTSTDWRNIGTVPGMDKENFQFYHDKPFGNTQYYRLKLTDRDGTFTYSKTVRINRGADRAVWSLWPNPTSGLLQVAHPTDVEGTVEVVNAIGAPVLRQRITPGSGLTELNTQSLSPGVYQMLTPGRSNSAMLFVKL